jgi:hypothetical protein
MGRARENVMQTVISGAQGYVSTNSTVSSGSDPAHKAVEVGVRREFFERTNTIPTYLLNN